MTTFRSRSVFPRLLIVWVLTLLAASCGRSDPQQRLCEAHIKSGLVNPETAEFFEFQNISEQEAERQFSSALIHARGLSEADRLKFADAFDYFDRLGRETLAPMVASGAKLKRFRVKADSRLGVKVTNEYVCAVTDQECGCFSDSTIAAQGRALSGG